MKNKGAASGKGTGSRMLCTLLVSIMLFGMAGVYAPSAACAEEPGAQGIAMQPLDDLDTLLGQIDDRPQSEEPWNTPRVPAETVWKAAEAADSKRGFCVSVEGFMPSDACLVLKPLSEKAEAYVIGERELAENEFLLVYQLCLVNSCGEEIKVVTGENDYKITVYFTERGVGFGEDLEMAPVWGTLGTLETAADNKAAEDAKAAAEAEGAAGEDNGAAEKPADGADDTDGVVKDEPAALDVETIPCFTKQADVAVKDAYYGNNFAWIVTNGLGLFRFSGTKCMAIIQQ